MVATDRQTHRQTDTQTLRRHAKNTFFGFSGPQNVNIHQNVEVDFFGKCNTFSILRITEKVKIKPLGFDPPGEGLTIVESI